MTSLCVDEESYDVCATLSRNACVGAEDRGAQLALDCARTCGICNVTRPSICRFPADLVGEWIEASNNQRITINQSVLTFEIKNKTVLNFQCITWGTTIGTKYDSQKPIDIMLAVGYNNGCRPRYICVRIHKKSSSVLYLRFSDSLPWPFTDSIHATIDCKWFAYDVAPASGQIDLLQTNHFRLIYVQQRRAAVNCNLPSDYSHLLLATFSDGGKCESVTVLESTAKTEMTISLRNCSQTTTDLKLLPKSYECIMSTTNLQDSEVINHNLQVDLSDQPNFELPGWNLRKSGESILMSTTQTSRKLLKNAFTIITKSTYNSNSEVVIFCWVFIENYVYIITVDQCDENSKNEVIQRIRKPLATFSLPSAERNNAQNVTKLFISDVMIRNNNLLSTSMTSSISNIPKTAILKRFQPDSIQMSRMENETLQGTEANNLSDLGSYAIDPYAFMILGAAALLVILYLPFMCLRN